MKQNSTIENRLAKYSAVAGIVVASSALNAQVQYVDVNPDQVVTNASGPFLLDLNADATPDMIFAVSVITGSFTSSSYNVLYTGNFPVVGGAFIAGASTWQSYPEVGMLNAGVTVDAAANWAGGSYGFMGYNVVFTIPPLSFTSTVTEGGWLGAGDKFIGMSFQAAGNTHYGWVRCNVAANGSTITIKDYAYQATPNCAINTGVQTGAACSTGIEDAELEAKVHVKNNFEFATVNVTPDLIGGTLRMTNIMGQEMVNQIINDVNTQVDFANLSSGVYMITAQFDGGQITKKIYVR